MRQLLRHPRLLDGIALLGLLATAFVLAQWAYWTQRVATFSMEAPAVLLPRTGLYGTEDFPDASGVYRWTNGYGRFHPPNPGGPTVIQLQLAGGPRNTVPVRIHATGTTLDFLVAPDVRTYTFLLPMARGERVSLTIESSIMTERGRDLGVIVRGLEVVGGGAAPPLLLLALGVATAGGYVLFRRVGWAVWQGAGGVLLAQALVLLWLAAGGWRYGRFVPLLLLAGSASLVALILERLWPPAARPGDPPPVILSLAEGRVVAILVLVWLGVRLPWITAADPVGDLELAARRMAFLHDYGLAGAYLYGGDYVPLRLYLLWGLSQLVQPLGGGFFAPLPPATLWLIKLPGLLADLATVILIYWWSRRWCGVRRSAVIALLYALAPPVWINIAWWGQVDTLLMLPLLGSVILLDRVQGRWSWLCWTVALLIKPQAILFAPLLYVATLRRHGSRGLVRGSLPAVGLLVVACAPLVLAGQGPGLAEAYLGSVGRFPYVTIGAYNLWYLVTLGAGGYDGTPVWGPLTYRLIGLLLMGATSLLVCFAMLRRADGPIRAEGAAVLALAFFVLPTQIHERYLFLSLAFMALCIASNERIVIPFTVLVLTGTINILGTLDGFVPLAHAFIAASPLPLICAIVHLGVLVLLSGHLLATSRCDGQSGYISPPAQQRPVSQC